jgi:hypothetical protein
MKHIESFSSSDAPLMKVPRKTFPLAGSLSRPSFWGRQQAEVALPPHHGCKERAIADQPLPHAILSMAILQRPTVAKIEKICWCIVFLHQAGFPLL